MIVTVAVIVVVTVAILAQDKTRRLVRRLSPPCTTRDWWLPQEGGRKQKTQRPIRFHQTRSYRKKERSSKNKQAASDKVSEWTTRNEIRAPYLFHFLVGVTNARVVFVKFLNSTCKAAAGMIRIKVSIHQNIQSVRGRRVV